MRIMLPLLDNAILPFCAAARTDTSVFSAPRGSRYCGDMWTHRISCCAEEQATRTRVFPSGLLLWIDGGRDPARKASRPERARSVARCADVRSLRAGIRRATGRFAARTLTFAASHVGLRPQYQSSPTPRVSLSASASRPQRTATATGAPFDPDPSRSPLTVVDT